MGETAKAFDRRTREGWFAKYINLKKPGIDIGCQYDPINRIFNRWDQIFGDGDCTLMEGVPNDAFSTTYCSHVLEHLSDPVKAVKRWFEITAPKGHLIIVVPHRDLYEGKKALPSRWNHDHKSMWLPEEEEAPDTRSLLATIDEALHGEEYQLLELRVIDEGCTPATSTTHASGEYSIEAVIKKL